MTDYVITGGLGFIGKNLTDELNKSSKDSSVCIIDKSSGTDLSDPPVVMPDYETLIHLASETNVRESILQPEYFISQNIKTILKCLNHIRHHKSRLIFTSSMGAPLSLSPYSASKLACESICKAYRESFNLDIKILRLSNVYGPHSLHKTSVIAKFIKLCLDKKPLTIIGNGNQTRDFVHVNDVVEAIINPRPPTITNVSSGQAITILSVAKLIKHISSKLTNFNPKLIFYPEILGEINQVDTKSNIEPTIDFEQGLNSTFKWFMENYKNAK